MLAIAMLAGCHALDTSPGAESDRSAKRAARAEPADSGSRFAARAAIGTARFGAIRPAALGPPPVIPGSTQFDVVGFLQEAHTTGPTTPGSLTVNGQVVTVPASTVVILPASSMTWDELFTHAPAPYGPAQTGLAMFDTPAPLATSEIHVIGNRVISGGSDAYIAGLIYLAQQSLNTGAGFINFIDYDLGEIRVGGTPNDPATGTRVRINDPVLEELQTGRYSKGLSPDPRFGVDTDNPTIISATGYPMCLPRVAPPGPTGLETDPLCPQGNRPTAGTGGPLAMNFTMPPPPSNPGQLPDPRIQAPLEIGDYVAFAGILATDNDATPTAGPWPGLPNTYVSAYSIVNNTAIYTTPLTDPAYIEIEVTLMGVGGQNVAAPGGAVGVAEAAARTRFEGMTTDIQRAVHLYAIDLDPTTGASTDRDLGTIGVDTGGTPGRWRFRPPCLPFGNVADDKNCVMNQAGSFLPPTREVRAVIEGLQGQASGVTTQTAANGLIFGQYRSPISEYVFPEPVPGNPIVPNNFEAIPFLACGGITLSDGTVAGPLVPWPGLTAPICEGAAIAPVASAGPAQTVAAGATVTLAGSASGTAPLTFAWVQTAGPAVALSDPASATPSFVAPNVTVATALAFSLTATNAAGSSTASVAVTVNAATAPTVAAIPPRTVASGTPVTLTATCTDPRGLPCTFVWTQTGGTPVVLTPNPQTTAAIRFQVQLAAAAPSATLTFSIVATNTAGVSSAPTTTSVTITSPADTVAITNAQYRTGKTRLDVSATSSVVSPTLQVTLQPYVTITGATFDPASLGPVFTNNNDGTYSLTLVGVPEPAIPPAVPLTVKSSAGGVSPPHGLDRIRQ